MVQLPALAFAMTQCSFVTVQLARFARLTSMGGANTESKVGNPVMWAIGADEVAAHLNLGTQKAFTWIALGLHDKESSARDHFAAGAEAVPYFADAAESWSAVLQPFSHRGSVNWLEPLKPGPVFLPGSAPEQDEPFVVITSAGWTFDQSFDPVKALDFGRGVVEVRKNMAAVEGLHSHHSFNFPTELEIDGATLTFWRDDTSMRSFAYRPGHHKTQLDRYRELHTADRTSFTRLRVLESRGSVNGSDPMALG